MVALMTPFLFDTLSASRQLREAGMPEGVAEAVVTVFQHAATMPDVSHLATKADLEQLSLATKEDLERLSLATRADLERLSSATKADLERLSSATKADLEALRSDVAGMATRIEVDAIRKEMATKADIADVRLEIADLRADLQATIRQQGWLIMGGVGVVVTISNAVLKVFS